MANRTGQRDKRESAGKGPKRSPIWKAFAPLMAFAAGPALVSLFWAFEVYVLEKESYVTSYERFDELIPLIPVGVLAGLVGAVIVATRVLTRD